MSPTRHSFESLGLPIAYFAWGAPHPTPVILLHGYLDHALSFTPLATHLAHSHHVLAPDHRGHGESGHIGPGGYYHFADYVLDLSNLFVAHNLERAHLVGHSMGATIAAYFAGTYPDKVTSLTLLDGIGPPAPPVTSSPALLRRWMNDIRLLSLREDAPMDSLEDVADRLARNSPNATRARLLALAETSTEETADHRYRWKFDPLHRTTAPIPFDSARFSTFLDQITAPTLIVWGERSPMRPPDAEDRMKRIANLRRETLRNTAHNLHHERPDDLAALIAPFLAEHSS